MNRKVLFGTLGAALLILVAVLIFARKMPGTTQNQNIYPSYEATEFLGQVTRVSGNTVFSTGLFQVSGHTEFQKPEYTKHVQVAVSQQTKFTKNKRYIKDNKISRTEKVAGSLADFTLSTKTNPGVDIFAKTNIYGKESFEAQEIIYNQDIKL